MSAARDIGGGWKKLTKCSLQEGFTENVRDAHWIVCFSYPQKTQFIARHVDQVFQWYVDSQVAEAELDSAVCEVVVTPCLTFDFVVVTVYFRCT